MHTALPKLPPDAIPELAAYFGEAWGNRSRIDYGSGMELNFLCWMICLERLGVVQESDHRALVIKVFWRCVRRCLKGSHPIRSLIHREDMSRSCEFFSRRIG